MGPPALAWAGFLGWVGVGEGGQEAWDFQSYDKKKKGTTPKIVNSLNFYEV